MNSLPRALAAHGQTRRITLYCAHDPSYSRRCVSQGSARLLTHSYLKRCIRDAAGPSLLVFSEWPVSRVVLRISYYLHSARSFGHWRPLRGVQAVREYEASSVGKLGSCAIVPSRPGSGWSRVDGMSCHGRTCVVGDVNSPAKMPSPGLVSSPRCLVQNPCTMRIPRFGST